ncbi:hypothetical protein [Flavobacterium sp. FlaQc-28]|uniref:hypothetical protein n=1 Tax=Flavobacterium sp. FlaQc-28 TaxID=3374178 RepID=UPI003757BC18
MTLNYNELLIYIEKIEKQLDLLKKEEQLHIDALNFKQADQLASKQQFIKLQILNYLAYYFQNAKQDNETCKEKINNLKKKYFLNKF